MGTWRDFMTKKSKKSKGGSVALGGLKPPKAKESGVAAQRLVVLWILFCFLYLLFYYGLGLFWLCNAYFAQLGCTGRHVLEANPEAGRVAPSGGTAVGWMGGAGRARPLA